MKQFWRLTSLISVLLAPFAWNGQVLAAPSITQEITVTAVVPPHRDIILDAKGQITQITSNTTEDVTPDAYYLTSDPAHKKTLTDNLYKQYRTYVPIGTAKYGILYQRSTSFTTVSATVTTLPLFKQT